MQAIVVDGITRGVGEIKVDGVIKEVGAMMVLVGAISKVMEEVPFEVETLEEIVTDHTVINYSIRIVQYLRII